MINKGKTLLFLSGGFLLGIVTSAVYFKTANSPLTMKGKRGAVGIIYIDGVIAESESTLKLLKKAKDAEAVKAVVLRINSPGGLVAPTWEIFREILELRKLKPVVASIESLGASGGYYIASAADKILVTPGTITGSIGVIIQTLNIKKILDWAGIRSVVIKSGEMKDSLSPYRDISQKEKKYLQSIVDEMFAQFLKDVAMARGINKEEIMPYADGRIITGEKAYELHLVDGFGNFYDAVNEAGRLAGIGLNPPIIRYVEKTSLFHKLFSSIFTGKWRNIFPESDGFVNTFFTYIMKIEGGGLQ